MAGMVSMWRAWQRPRNGATKELYDTAALSEQKPFNSVQQEPTKQNGERKNRRLAGNLRRHAVFSHHCTAMIDGLGIF
jgi:hypothetical protein